MKIAREVWFPNEQEPFPHALFSLVPRSRLLKLSVQYLIEFQGRKILTRKRFSDLPRSNFTVLQRPNMYTNGFITDRNLFRQKSFYNNIQQEQDVKVSIISCNF